MSLGRSRVSLQPASVEAEVSPASPSASGVMTSIFTLVLIASPVTARSCPADWGDGAMRAVYELMRSIQPQNRGVVTACHGWIAGLGIQD